MCLSLGDCLEFVELECPQFAGGSSLYGLSVAVFCFPCSLMSVYDLDRYVANDAVDWYLICYID